MSTKQEKNIVILNTCFGGYSQVSITTYLKLSKFFISRIVKSGDLFIRISFNKLEYLIIQEVA